ncbi:outer membrane beta-barrel protein [Gynurincola endophyticus]|jgi:hypothetical protein|uniref:outer membrane beta-barrel protein n=1 Tax=Gynurincola endophyticus TaxID=2479004 RepID=UPI000F8DD30F|nr:outer membrane beta-barrel protein [Gynurincola endophyticus]
MKKGLFLLMGIAMCTIQLKAQDADTLRIGNIIIVKKSKGSIPVDSTGGPQSGGESNVIEITKKKNKNITTNWFTFDLGFNNWTDKTDYASAGVQDPTTGIAPGATDNWLDLRAGKSINFNLWVVSQKVNIINHHLNLKYAIGIESNNYRFKRPVIFNEEPYDHLVMDNTNSYSKNKLRADYLTVPVMLNWNFSNKKGKNFGLSAGISAGYLYTAKQKTITTQNGKQKDRVDFNLNPFKISYVGEINLGHIQLYGSMATKSMFKNNLDLTPFNVGLRFSSL